MAAAWRLAILLILIVHDSEQISNSSSSTYKVAVLEQWPHSDAKNATPTLGKNAAAYGSYITDAAKKGVDIFVFPEYGLTSLTLPPKEELGAWSTVVPHANENFTPCGSSAPDISDTLKGLSCAVKRSQIYAVINLIEKCSKSECPSEEPIYYNTNVVFDRNGQIIARYRKTNLFYEDDFNTPKNPEYVTFETDFGVTFGTFTSFDILFKEPAIHLTRTLGIRDFVFPTAWFSESPFLTALQIQHGWSYAEDVNLLAAGYDDPQQGNAGSGIYLGRQGIGKTIIPMEHTQQLLIYDVPKKKLSSQRDHILNRRDVETRQQDHVHDDFRNERNDHGLLLKYDPELPNFESMVLDKQETSEELCHGGFCCKFKVKMGFMDSDTTYRIVVFNGIRKFIETIEAPTTVCAVLQCSSNDTLSSCGRIKDSETRFEVIEVSGLFERNDDTLVMPNTLDSSLNPLKEWEFHDSKKEEAVTMRLYNSTMNLVTFGIYARNFHVNPPSLAGWITALICIAVFLVVAGLSYLCYTKREPIEKQIIQWREHLTKKEMIPKNEVQMNNLCDT